MGLVDRYIIKLFLGYLVGGLLVFVTLYLAAHSLSYAMESESITPGQLIKYNLYQIPTVVYQLTPVACLMATLFTYSGLYRSNEMVALFSSGVSLFRLSLPTLILSIGLAGALFFMSDQVIPRFNQKKNYVEYVEIQKRPWMYSTVKTDRIWYRSENILFNIQTLNPAAAKAQGITLYYFDNAWNLVQLITAREVDMKDHAWTLKNGFVTLFTSESSFPLTKAFDTKVVNMTEDLGDLQTSSNSSDIMTVKELSHFIDHNKEAGLDTVRYEVDYHSKFGFAFTALIMTLLGIPFSVNRSRSGGAMVNIGICVGVAFAYWTIYSSFITLGQHGAFPPVMAAWTANVLMAAGSWILLRRLNF